jgi:hypothetical protein
MRAMLAAMRKRVDCMVMLFLPLVRVGVEWRVGEAVDLKERQT